MPPPNDRAAPAREGKHLIEGRDMTVSRKCKCGSCIGDDTPAKGKMCMTFWTASLNQPAGRRQARISRPRPGNPKAILDLDEASEKRDESFDARMTEFLQMSGGYADEWWYERAGEEG